MEEYEIESVRVKVIDDLNEAFANGTDEEFLTALECFCTVADRLPKASYLSVEYMWRILGIVNFHRLMSDVKEEGN